MVLEPKAPPSRVLPPPLTKPDRVWASPYITFEPWSPPIRRLPPPEAKLLMVPASP
jgi:hypothetical protein